MPETQSISLPDAEHVMLKQLPDGVEIRIAPQSHPVLPMMALSAVTVFGGLIGAIALYKSGRPMSAVKLGAFTAMGFVGLVVWLLIWLVSGNPGEQVLVAKANAVAIDRYMLGDHIARTFNSNEVVAVFVEDTSVFVSTRIGDTVIADMLLSSEMADSLAQTVATWLWHGREVDSQKTATRSMYVLRPAVAEA